MKYHIFHISTGYAETASLGYVQFCTYKGYDSVLEGVYELGNAIKRAMEKRRDRHNAAVEKRREENDFLDCCEVTLATAPNRFFCQRCVMPIRKKKDEILEDDIENKISHFIRSTNDESDNDILTLLQEEGWDTYEPHINKEHYRVYIDSFVWNAELLSPEFRKHCGMEWRVMKCSSPEYFRADEVKD